MAGLQFSGEKVFRLDLNESREGFCRRGRERSFHIDGPKVLTGKNLRRKKKKKKKKRKKKNEKNNNGPSPCHALGSNLGYWVCTDIDPDPDGVRCGSSRSPACNLNTVWCLGQHHLTWPCLSAARFRAPCPTALWACFH